MSKPDPSRNHELTKVLGKAKQFLPLIRHAPCYSYSQVVLDTIICKQTQMSFVLKCLYQTRKVSLYLYFRSVNCVSFYEMCVLDFSIVPTVEYFFVFHFIND